MSARQVLAAAIAAAGIGVFLPSVSSALPVSGSALGSLTGERPLVQEARVFCYNRATGRFLHWGPCGRRYAPRRTVPRVYCRNRYTGRFLYWGACRR